MCIIALDLFISSWPIAPDVIRATNYTPVNQCCPLYQSTWHAESHVALPWYQLRCYSVMWWPLYGHVLTFPLYTVLFLHEELHSFSYCIKVFAVHQSKSRTFLNLSKHRWSVCLHSKVRFFNILPFDTRNNCFLKIIDLRTLYQNSEAWQLCHGMAKENMLICGGKLDKLIKRCNNHVFEYILNNSPEMVYNFISAIIIYQLTS